MKKFSLIPIFIALSFLTTLQAQVEDSLKVTTQDSTSLEIRTPLQEKDSTKFTIQDQNKESVKGEILLTNDGKGFIKEGEKFTFGKNYEFLEKAVSDCPRAMAEIRKARGQSRSISLFGSLAGGMSGAGLAIALEGGEGSKGACWAMQGLCCGFLALAYIPISAQKNHILNAINFYNEDLKAGRLIK